MGKRRRSGNFPKNDDYSKKSDDGDSQDSYGEPGGSQRGNLVKGIRCSARVQEKQKNLKRKASPSKQTMVDSPSTSTISVHCPTTVKVNIGDDSLDASPYESPFTASSPGEKKKERTWELWSQEDQQLFFEALNDFGKDFDSIQNYLALKVKPKSKASSAQYVSKNKEQVRHFYYRTWNKISKYLTFPKNMKKAYQELYGLINYGELRKKHRVLNLKAVTKLSELVERGATTTKVRGKTFRIKTPLCRALKELNQLEEIDHIRVPCKLFVELVPRDGNTWASVQKVSHNPRVKLDVPPQRTLASIISYFEERWKTNHNRLTEEFSLTMFARPRRLRFIPVETCDLNVPVLKLSEATSATKINLSSNVRNCLSHERKDEFILGSKIFKGEPKLYSETQANRDPHYLDSEADVSDADGCEATQEDQFRSTLWRDKFLGSTLTNLKRDVFMNQDNSNGFPGNPMWSVRDAATKTDVGETDCDFDKNLPSPNEGDDNSCAEDCMDQGIQEKVIYKLQDTFPACTSLDLEENDTLAEKCKKHCTCGMKAEDIGVVGFPTLDSETIARGWSAEDAGALTIGEIHLMLGKCDKICFEYQWDKSEEDMIQEERVRNMVNRLEGVARHLKKRNFSRAKTTISSTIAKPTDSTYICTKCTEKTESPSTVDTVSAIYNISCDGTSKDLYDSSLLNSPIRTTQRDFHDESKITLDTVSDNPLEKSAVKTEAPQNGNITAEPKSNLNLNITSTEKEEVRQVCVQTEIKPSTNRIEESSTTSGLVRAESIISTNPETSTAVTPSGVPVPCSLSSQTGLIETTSIANSNSSTLPELNGSFAGVTSSITATVVPTSPSILRSVALTPLRDFQKTTFLTPMTVTNTVLVGKPAIFKGLTAEASSFVTIQPSANTATVVTSPRSASKIHEAKFRRPSEIPIAMKPSTDVKMTNEDGTPKVNVPKPFFDLPKGNRRIGRRPAWKQRVIIPRMLPLLPKPDKSMLKSAAVATIIAIPPVVATGLSIVPANPVAALPATSDDVETSTSISTSNLSTPLLSTTTFPSSQGSTSSSSIPTFTSSSTTLPVPGTTSSEKHVTTKNTVLLQDKPLVSKNDTASNFPTSSRTFDPGCYEETLDNFSLSPFMDISLPESNNFLANEALEDLEYETNMRIDFPGLYDSNGSNPRDPSLVETPRKQPGHEDSQLTIPSPHRLAPMDTSWPNMNQSADFFMGGIFSGDAEIQASLNELSEGDPEFRAMVEDDFHFELEMKLDEHMVHLAGCNFD